MTAAERGVRAAMAALTDAEIRRLVTVEVRERPYPGGVHEVSVSMRFEFPGPRASGHAPAAVVGLSPKDINAALAAEGEKCALAQRPG